MAGSTRDDGGKALLGRSAFNVSLALIGFGFYRLLTRADGEGAPWVAIWLFGLGIVGLVSVAVSRASGLSTPSGVADQMIDQHRQLYGGLHTYRDATPADYVGLDKHFYDAKASELRAEGFRHVRDIVNLTLQSSWPRCQTVLKCFLGDQGTTMATAYHVRLFGFVRLLQFIRVVPWKLQTVECESELSDGSFVVTANTFEADKTLGFPGISRRQLPGASSVADIVRTHRDHMRELLTSKPGVVPCRISGYEQLRAAQDRMQLIKNGHRNSEAFDVNAEWRNVAGRELSDDEREAVARIADGLRRRPTE